jgi:uncharacterized protein
LLVFLLGLFSYQYGAYIMQNPTQADSAAAKAYDANASLALSLMFPAAIIAYLFFRGRTASWIVGDLGLKRKGISFRSLIAGILLFLGILAVEFGFAAIQAITGIQIPTNVQEVLGGMPLYFLIFTATLAPVCEEVFFRGFLVRRIGIILSALIFAFFHFGYGSVAEFGAAFVFGLLAGYAFKKTDSLYPSIIAHVLVNTMALLALLF